MSGYGRGLTPDFDDTLGSNDELRRPEVVLPLFCHKPAL